MSKNNKLQYIKDASVPSFIQKFKEQAGMKAPPTIEDKKHKPEENEDDDNYQEKEDEKPVVVVLGKNDLNEEEVKKEIELHGENNGKVVFRKPAKRKMENALSASTKKNKVNSNEKKEVKSEKKKEKSTKSKSTLLSFNEEEDE